MRETMQGVELKPHPAELLRRVPGLVQQFGMSLGANARPDLPAIDLRGNRNEDDDHKGEQRDDNQRPRAGRIRPGTWRAHRDNRTRHSATSRGAVGGMARCWPVTRIENLDCASQLSALASGR